MGPGKHFATRLVDHIQPCCVDAGPSCSGAPPPRSNSGGSSDPLCFFPRLPPAKGPQALPCYLVVLTSYTPFSVMFYPQKTPWLPNRKARPRSQSQYEGRAGTGLMGENTEDMLGLQPLAPSEAHTSARSSRVG